MLLVENYYVVKALVGFRVDFIIHKKQIFSVSQVLFHSKGLPDDELNMKLWALDGISSSLSSSFFSVLTLMMH